MLGALALASCSVKGMLMPMHLSDYRGDGTISRIRLLPNPGVMVEFPPFSLGKPHHAKYRLDGLPRRPFPYFMSLVVPYPEDYVVSREHGLYRVPGTLDLALRDESGSVVFQCHGEPWWSAVFGGTFSNAEAQFGTCDGPRGDKPYILPEDLRSTSFTWSLDIAWEPTEATPDVEGRLTLRSGGTT